MTKPAIHISESDMTRLRQLTGARLLAHSAQLELLARLEEELDRAEIVEPDALPKDIIQMDSRVLVRDSDSGREAVYHLVYPSQSWGKADTLSVLAPLGIALLGYRVGDLVEAITPGGVRRVKVLALLDKPEPDVTRRIA